MEHDEEQAEEIFQNIAKNAEYTFREDPAGIIKILIHVGKLYQDRNRWAKTAAWFERALAGSMATSDPESPLTKTLEEALEKRHYSSTCEQNTTLTLDEARRIKSIL